ncbi:MAG TPA: hypothetical protein PLT93_14920, partial [Phycisphaerae bacterium]|nr:hypothetical protein [Phycisphaerae bacterium]
MLSSAVGVVAEMKPVNLRCEYLENPLGIDVPRPRLSWQLESPYRNRRQAAYQILVATHPDRLTPDQADLWNSGRVESNQSLHVEYAGKPLISGMPAH